MTKTEAKWRALIAEQERSGLTARAFAASRGVTAATLYWWRCRLGQRRAPADLVPVEVVERDIVVEPRRATGVDFEVHLESGATLRAARTDRLRRGVATSAGAGAAMLSLPTSVRIYLARGATDMRKSIDGLVAA